MDDGRPSKVVSVRADRDVRPERIEGLAMLELPNRLSDDDVRLRSPETWRRDPLDMLPRMGADDEEEDRFEAAVAEESRREEEEREVLSRRLL